MSTHTEAQPCKTKGISRARDRLHEYSVESTHVEAQQRFKAVSTFPSGIFRLVFSMTSSFIPTPQIELVVARFNEPLNWLRRVPSDIRITVYDKSESHDASESNTYFDDHAPRFNRLMLPNIGRESHTYLQHIIERLQSPASLAPLTIFCQGKPFDHAFDFHRTLRQLAHDAASIGDASVDAVARHYAQTVRAASVADERLIIEAQAVVARCGWAPLGHIADSDDPRGERLFKGWSKNEDGRVLDVAEFHRALFDSPQPDQYTFRLGAQFIVTSDCIRRRSLAFYRRALQMSVEFPDAPHCFERAWPFVFDVPNPDSVWLEGYKTAYLKPLQRPLSAPPSDAIEK